MRQISEEAKQKLFNSAKNLWFSALFENIAGYFPDITFEEQKELFFSLTEELLEKKMINFDHPPIEEFKEQTGFWEADTKTIMQYLKDGFPQHATHEYDSDVNLYFYIVAPAVAWLQDDGTYYGS